MENWILTISIFILIMVELFFEKKNIISPFIIIAISCFSSSLVVSINTIYWNYLISWKTYGLIMGALISFLLGERLFNNIAFSQKKIKKMDQNELKSPTTGFYILAIIYGAIVFIVYFRQQRNNASLLNMAGSLSSIIQANRFFENDQMESNSIIRLFYVVFKAIDYVAIALLFFAHKSDKNKSSIFFTIILTLEYIFCSVLTTNRTEMLYLALYIMVLIIINFILKAGDRKQIKKLFFITVVVGVIALFLFRMLGYLTGKSNSSSTYDNICCYFGGGIVSLDKFLNGAYVVSDSYSPQLLKGIYSILNRLGANISIVSYTLPHQYWNHGSGNIYTSLFSYYLKFGAIGTILLEFFFGIFYGIWWKKIKNRDCGWLSLLLFSDFVYTLAYFPIAERFFSQLFTLTTLIEILSFYLLVKYFTQKKESILK